MVSLSYCMAFLSFLYFLIFFPCLVFTGHSMRHIFFSFNEDLICFLPFKDKSVFFVSSLSTFSLLSLSISTCNMRPLLFGILPIKENSFGSLSSVTVALCLLTLLLMVIWGQKSKRSFFHFHLDSQLDHTKYPPPPGPKPWPLVGNLLQVGDQIHLSLTGLRLQYGDIFKVHIVIYSFCIISFRSTEWAWVNLFVCVMDPAPPWLFDCCRSEWVQHHQAGSGSTRGSFCGAT